MPVGGWVPDESGESAVVVDATPAMMLDDVTL